MAVSFPRLSRWFWSGKERDPISNGSSLNSSSELGFGLRDFEAMRFPSVKGSKLASPLRKVKKKWKSREERKIDREYDVVLVPSDGVCLSGSESDDSDWSIGWLEPHGPEFQSDDESDNSFAVLVPCYSPGCKEVVESSNIELLSAIRTFQTQYSPDGETFIEQWLSSTQNSSGSSS